MNYLLHYLFPIFIRKYLNLNGLNKFHMQLPDTVKVDTRFIIYSAINFWVNNKLFPSSFVQNMPQVFTKDCFFPFICTTSQVLDICCLLKSLRPFDQFKTNFSADIT